MARLSKVSLLSALFSVILVAASHHAEASLTKQDTFDIGLFGNDQAVMAEPGIESTQRTLFLESSIGGKKLTLRLVLSDQLIEFECPIDRRPAVIHGVDFGPNTLDLFRGLV